MKFSPGLATLLLLPIAVVLLAFIVGSVDLFAQAFRLRDGWGLGNFEAFFGRADFVRAFFVTHGISLTAAAICVIIAYPLADAMVRYPSWRTPLILLTLTPMLTSLVVRTFAWLVMLGNSGIVNDLILFFGLVEEPVRLLFNRLGVVIGLVHIFCPLAVFSIYTVLIKVDPRLTEASMSLGVGPIGSFFRVTLPLAANGIANAFSITYLLSTGAVITPLLLGGPTVQMLGTLVYSNIFTYFNFPRAATIGILLVVSSFAVVIMIRMTERRLSRHLDARAG